MAKVEIVRSLFQQIQAKFKGESHQVIDLLESMEFSPHKGKFLGTVGDLAIKELKYKNFRFYFVTDGFTLKCFDEEKLVDLLLLFVRMSDKNHQQQTINEIKQVLRTMGAGGFQ